MKAYSVTDDQEYAYSTVVFAETRGQARMIAQHTDACEDVEFTHIRALRVPQLDKYYRGISEMDWKNDEDRIAMVRDANYSCSYEIWDEHLDCDNCPATQWCERYERINDNV